MNLFKKLFKRKETKNYLLHDTLTTIFDKCKYAESLLPKLTIMYTDNDVFEPSYLQKIEVVDILLNFINKINETPGIYFNITLDISDDCNNISLISNDNVRLVIELANFLENEKYYNIRNNKVIGIKDILGIGYVNSKNNICICFGYRE